MRALLLALLLAAPAAAADPEAEAAVSVGTVSAVHPLEARFEIVGGGGERLRFRIDPATVVREGERRIHDQRLQPGDRVRVHGSPGGLAGIVEIFGRDEDPEEPPPLRAARVAAANAPRGRVLVDASSGMALYAFSRDETGEDPLDDASSHCTGECERLWPPLLTTGPPFANPGVLDGLLSHFDRAPQRAHAPAIQQVSYDGWPLYRFHGDEPFTERGPGTTGGEGQYGFGGFFRVVTPEGFSELVEPRGLPPPPPKLEAVPEAER